MIIEITAIFPTCEAAARCLSDCNSFCQKNTVVQYSGANKRIWIILSSLARENDPEQIAKKIINSIALHDGKIEI